MITSITLNPDAPPAALNQTVQLAESLGFEECYIADQGFSRDVYVTLAAVAAATSRIRLGPGVTHPYTRHPAATAVAIAALDELSGQRAFLGLGAGGSRTLTPLQIERASPLQACREAVEIARLLWRGEANYSGKHFQLAHARLTFPCRPNIPVHWAARGPRMLALGGELADVVILHAIPRFDIPSVVECVRQGAARTNRMPRLQYAVALVHSPASREAARRRTVYRLVDSSTTVKERLGITPTLEAEIRRLVSTSGPAAAAHLVPDEVLSQFILEGDARECARQLRQLFAANGLDGLTIEVTDPANSVDLLRHAATVIEELNLDTEE
jgi:5,10-methylenetetrahydromethanopterin reductase